MSDREGNHSSWAGLHNSRHSMWSNLNPTTPWSKDTLPVVETHQSAETIVNYPTTGSNTIITLPISPSQNRDCLNPPLVHVQPARQILRLDCKKAREETLISFAEETMNHPASFTRSFPNPEHKPAGSQQECLATMLPKNCYRPVHFLRIPLPLLPQNAAPPCSRRGSETGRGPLAQLTIVPGLCNQSWLACVTREPRSPSTYP
jgi:hypothetical protein